jgi:hypothetical protein
LSRVLEWPKASGECVKSDRTLILASGQTVDITRSILPISRLSLDFGTCGTSRAGWSIPHLLDGGFISSSSTVAWTGHHTIASAYPFVVNTSLDC